MLTPDSQTVPEALHGCPGCSTQSYAHKGCRVKGKLLQSAQVPPAGPCAAQNGCVRVPCTAPVYEGHKDFTGRCAKHECKAYAKLSNEAAKHLLATT